MSTRARQNTKSQSRGGSSNRGGCNYGNNRDSRNHGHSRNQDSRKDKYNDTLISYIVKGFDISGVDSDPRNAKKRVIAEMNDQSFSGDALDKLGQMCKWMLAKYPLSVVDQVARSQSRATEIKRIAGDINPRSYYDLGCGDGNITAAIGGAYGLSKKDIYGADMFDATAPITAIRLESSKTKFAINPGSVRVPDASVDLITAFVSLHHIEALDSTLAELQRIATPKCVLIIREHDTDDPMCKLFLNRYHAAMMMTGVGELAGAGIELSNWEDAKAKITAYMDSINYRPLTSWNTILAKYGFKFVSSDKYTGFNPQELFYAKYIKE